MAGALTDENVEQLLIMIHPATWDPSFEKGGKDEHRKGVLNMKIHEEVKLQLCYLLHHLCDVQVGKTFIYSCLLEILSAMLYFVFIKYDAL